MKRTIVAAVAAALLIAACGASADPPATTTNAPATSASPTPTVTPEESMPSSEPPAAIATAEDVVAATGCTGYEVADQPAPFAATYGTCSWKGGRLQVYTFASEGDMASFFDSVKAFGVTESQVAVVGLVVAAPASQKNLAALRDALGA